MAQAAAVVEERGAQIVDINMGCWVPKVAKKGGGAALLRDLDRAVEVVAAVKRAVEIPVTVKVRSGWTEPELTAIDFSVGAEQAGAQAITVHARYADQGFTGEADYSVIARVVETVKSIPIIGNGDIESAEDVRRMVKETGCQGVMIGRAALGRPWLFAHLWEELLGKKRPPRPSLAERARCALRHAEITAATSPKPLMVALREMRGQLSRYKLDAKGQTTIRDRLVRLETMDEVRELLDPLMVESTELALVEL